MDDGRSFMQPVKRGWKWQGGELLFSRGWELEEMEEGVTPEGKTKIIMLESMQGVETYLEFTVESPEDFDGWLPTLDTNLRVEKDNQISYKFYEKPTSTNTVIRKESALSENQKIQILSQELVRRLFNTKETLNKEYRSLIINEYTQKIINSGYSSDQVKKIILSGIKGYFGKVRRRRKDQVGKRIHRTAQESGGSRWKRKLLGKTTWYRSKRKKDGEETTPSSRIKGRSVKDVQHRGKEDLKTRAVLFVPQTPMGELATRTREVLERMKEVMGFRLKVVERAGVSLQNQFSQSALWRSLPCERKECIPCMQGGEEVPECTKTSVVYENICLVCNPSAASKGDLKTQETNTPSLYVGESSRSLQERMVEHWSSYRRKEEGSHIRKHQEQHHPDKDPRFLVKAISYHRTALSRQIREAVRIRKRGGESSILNSKSEFNRCYIPRLVVDTVGEEEMEKARIEEVRKLTVELDLEEDEWRNQKCGDRDRERRKRKDAPLGVGVLSTIREDEEEYVWGRRKKRRKVKHEILGEDWGIENEDDLLCLKEDDRNQPIIKDDQAFGDMKDDKSVKTPKMIPDHKETPTQDPGHLHIGIPEIPDSPLENSSYEAKEVFVLLKSTQGRGSVEGTNRIEESNTVVDRGGGCLAMEMKFPGDKMMKSDVMQGENTKESVAGVVGEDVPDMSPTPSTSDGNRLILLRNGEDDIMRGPGSRDGDGYLMRPDSTPMMMDRSDEVPERTKKRMRATSTRLESSSTCKTLQITDYYAPAKKRKMNDDEVFPGLESDDEGWWLRNTQEYVDRMAREVVTKENDEEVSLSVPNTRGQQLVLVEDDDAEWPGTREEQDDWTEVAVSFLERSECATPSRTQNCQEDQISDPVEEYDMAKMRGTRLEVAELGTPDATQGGYEVNKEEEDALCEFNISDDEWTEVAMSWMNRIDDTLTREKERSDELANVRGPHLNIHEVVGEDDSNSVEGVEVKENRDEEVTIVTPDMSDDDTPGTDTGHQIPRVVDDITTGVDMMILTDTVCVDTDNVRGTQLDLPVDGTVDPGDVGVSRELLPLTTQQQTLHPPMVSGSRDGDHDRPNVACSYTDGVCSIHGPATKKWRGGKVWGKKSNGLYGWKFGRKTYFVCEKKPSVRGVVTDDEDNEPTFILMRGSKDRLSLGKTLPGGKGGYTVKRFSDSKKMSNQPAAGGS